MYGEPVTYWSEGWADARTAMNWGIDPEVITAHLRQMLLLGETGPECPTCWAAENQPCLVVGSLYVAAKRTHKARREFAGVL